MIKVNKEVADRLKFMLNNNDYTKESILEQHVKGWKRFDNKCINQLKLSELAECLFLGYEVEETIEDKILENYNRYNDIPNFDDYIIGFKLGYSEATKTILDLYNIKIEGINA